MQHIIKLKTKKTKLKRKAIANTKSIFMQFKLGAPIYANEQMAKGRKKLTSKALLLNAMKV